MTDLKLTLGAKLPGEDLVVAVLGFVARFRETMDPDVRTEWDRIALADYKAWRKLWVNAGLLPDVDVPDK